MTTIDNLDISIYIQYARRTQYVEEVNEQYHMQEASAIPPQTLLTDFYPKLSELDLLLGASRSQTPWAYFYPPENFQSRRRSPFAFSRVSPTLGSLEEQEKLVSLIEETPCATPEEKREKRALLACMKQLHVINNWLGDIIGRIGQFLQG